MLSNHESGGAKPLYLSTVGPKPLYLSTATPKAVNLNTVGSHRTVLTEYTTLSVP